MQAELEYLRDSFGRRSRKSRRLPAVFVTRRYADGTGNKLPPAELVKRLGGVAHVEAESEIRFIIPEF